MIAPLHHSMRTDKQLIKDRWELEKVHLLRDNPTWHPLRCGEIAAAKVAIEFFAEWRSLEVHAIERGEPEVCEEYDEFVFWSDDRRGIKGSITNYVSDLSGSRTILDDMYELGWGK